MTVALLRVASGTAAKQLRSREGQMDIQSLESCYIHTCDVLGLAARVRGGLASHDPSG